MKNFSPNSNNDFFIKSITMHQTDRHVHNGKKKHSKLKSYFVHKVNINLMRKGNNENVKFKVNIPAGIYLTSYIINYALSQL